MDRSTEVTIDDTPDDVATDATGNWRAQSSCLRRRT
jgi:hypothetical protein